MPVVEINHVTKEFRLGALQNFKQSMRNLGSRLRGLDVVEQRPFKALNDVNFTVEAGEVLGIIGHNGAGKSTLLKMLARISSPTRGSVKVHGRIAPLIEVGAGFVSDFTGRENVYLNGAILGMSRKEIQRKFDEIVDFAEMAKFIDTPVKRYSSGMQVRLAFAVATSIDAEVLIVDEVLAVGDLAFQRKCFNRMEQLIKSQGRTVLIVSHNIRQVERMCSRTILMDHGQVIADGPSREVCNVFYEQNDARVKEGAVAAAGLNASGATTADVNILSVSFVNADGRPVDVVLHNAGALARVRFKINRSIVSPIFGLGVHTIDFIYLATAISEERFAGVKLAPGIYEAMLRIDNFPFLPGVYSLRLGINEGELTSTIFYAESVFNFQVSSALEHRTQAMQEGLVELPGEWSLKPLVAVPGTAPTDHSAEIAGLL
jgi:ABC-type polysaccharide/polyol phosphate transport system ATPase subunit